MTDDAGTKQIMSGEAGLFHDPGLRFPIFTGAKGYEAMPFLSREEKAAGVGMLWCRWETPDQKPEEYAVQARKPAYVMQSDPLLWQETMRNYAVVTKLLCGTMYDSESVERHQGAEMHDRIKDPNEPRRCELGQLMVIAKIARSSGSTRCWSC